MSSRQTASGSAPSGSASGSAARQSNSTSISIPATAAAGGLTMINPSNRAEPSYYKIASGEFITFEYNLTSLYVTPQSLTFLASCSANGNTYAVGPTASPSNTIAGNATQVIWSPWEWEQIPGQVPFAEATYVLKVMDERGDGVGIKGGMFSPYSGTSFSLYRPASYQSIADGWKCSTCNAALSTFSEPMGLGVMLSLALVFISTWNFVRR